MQNKNNPKNKAINNENCEAGYFNEMECRICYNPMPYIESIMCGISSGANFYSKPIDIESYKIPIYYCYDCTHMQIPYLIPEEIYNEYCYSGYVTNNYFSTERKRQIDFMCNVNKSRGLFIDIGCGEGSCLEIAKEKFDEVLGIEPSKVYGKILSDKRIPYITDYFSKELLGERRCDFFFSSQVFEHLTDPISVLKDIYSVCNDNGVGIIEVPNGELNWIEKDFTYIIPDHINYFSPQSLIKMANKAGFSVNYCNCYDGKNLEILLHKRVVINSFADMMQTIIKKLEDLPKNKEISFWGAGAKMFALLPLIEKHASIKNIYDNDPGKHNCYIPGCKTSIIKPSVESVNANDIIVLINTKYDQEIIDELREKYGYRGDIRVI